MIKPRSILMGLVLFAFTACERHNIHRYQATEVCHNLIITVNQLNPHEKIVLLYDTRLLLRHKIDSPVVINFNRTFCNTYRNKGVLRLIIKSNKNVIIDTSLLIEKPKLGYKLLVNRTPTAVILIKDTSAINNH